MCPSVTVAEHDPVSRSRFVSLDEPRTLFALVFASLGGLFAVIALGVGISRRAFLARAQRVDGVVVDTATSWRGSGVRRRIVYHPVVRFSFGGASYRVRGAVGYDTPPSSGRRVFVLIDPKSPTTPLIDEFPEKWSTVVMSAITGAIFFVAAVAVLMLT
jgi:hypothetical protein